MATGEANGRPQHSQSGGTIASKESRHRLQMGIRLALVRIWSQIRQGAGNSTDVTASSALLKITDALLTKELPEQPISKWRRMEGAGRGLQRLRGSFPN